MVIKPPHGFEQLIAWRTGLHMRQEDKEKWRAILNPRLVSVRLSSLEEYYQLLISDTDKSKAEWRELLAILTTGESYFFRDKGQFSLLKNLLLPEIIERRQKDLTLRIWSAGCSTGEEPYSVAILVDELLPQMKEWDILILGTDINEKAIEKAKKGVYGQWSFRMTDPDLRKRHFRNRIDVWELDEKIRRMVKFRTGNLMENRFPDRSSDIHDMDIILCRNVFIYFNSESVAVVLDKFIETLNEEGYLITGHGELYGQSLGSLRPRMFPESVVHQKTSLESGVGSLELEEKEKSTAEVEKLKSYEVEKNKFQASKLPGFSASTVEESKVQIPKPKIEELPTPNSELENYFLKAQEYADTGQYDKAAAECKKAIDFDKTAVKPYFLLSHIYEMKGNNEEAKDLLKRIIYLAPDFIAAYLELGSLYERENDAERARKMRTTALELLKALKPETAIEPYKEVTAGELLEYVKKML